MNLPGPHGFWIDDRRFQLDRNYSIFVTGIGWVHIATGFVYDGQSIPRMLWPIVGNPFAGKSQPAALIHDALCRSKLVKRARADQAFRHLLEANEAEKPAAKYWAVRTAGELGIPRYKASVVAQARRQVTLIEPEHQQAAENPYDGK